MIKTAASQRGIRSFGPNVGGVKVSPEVTPISQSF